MLLAELLQQLGTRSAQGAPCLAGGSHCPGTALCGPEAIPRAEHILATLTHHGAQWESMQEAQDVLPALALSLGAGYSQWEGWQQLSASAVSGPVVSAVRS